MFSRFCYCFKRVGDMPFPVIVYCLLSSSILLPVCFFILHTLCYWFSKFTARYLMVFHGGFVRLARI